MADLPTIFFFEIWTKYFKAFPQTEKHNALMLSIICSNYCDCSTKKNQEEIAMELHEEDQYWPITLLLQKSNK